MEYVRTALAVRDILNLSREDVPLSEILQLVLTRLCELTGALHGCFTAYDPASEKYLIIATHGPDWTDSKKTLRFNPDQGIIGLVAQKTQPFLSPDIASDAGTRPIFENARSVLAMPVIVREKTWGVIELNALTPGHFEATAMANAHLLAEIAASAVSSRMEHSRVPKTESTSNVHSLRDTVAGVAHEINNPLTSILFHASLLTLKRGGKADDASIQAIAESAQRAAELVRSLRALNTEMAVQTEILGLNAIITQAVNLVKIQLADDAVNIRPALEPFSPQVQVNGPALLDALLCLLNNAVEAARWAKPRGEVTLKVRRALDNAIVEITDNGSGIPESLQKNIFDPFVSTKSVGKGPGLGLSRARATIESFGGKLSLISSSASGTTFQIDLPLALEASTSFLTSPGSSAETKKIRGRILLVDDEPDILEPLADYLAIKNIAASTQTSAPAALALLQKEKFDVIVSDIRMPQMTGLEFYEKALKLDARYKTHFVFITGDLVRGDNRERVAATGCACLEKPFGLDALYQSVLPFLPKS
jgi:signal transduction histidine kinase